MHALRGIGVIVTRPEQQAESLCRLLETRGAVTRRMPAIEIRPMGDLASWTARLGAIDAFGLIVFTSANAVRFGSELLAQRHDLVLAAIGPATARALQESGFSVEVQPDGRFDSEALLAHPRFEKISGSRILLIKGRHGRPFLEDELTRRGAQVIGVDVYERLPAWPATAELAAMQMDVAVRRLQVITATSVEIGSHLLQLSSAVNFQELHWLVPGERVASGLRERGLNAPLLTAASAEDQDLVAALLRWKDSR